MNKNIVPINLKIGRRIKRMITTLTHAGSEEQKQGKAVSQLSSSLKKQKKLIGN